MKCELSNKYKFLALKYHCLTKKSLERSFRWAKRNFDSYFKLIDKYKYEKNDLYIEKEFIFQGFVPENEFKKKKGFEYISSNRPINGRIYIYPFHLTHDYKHLKKGYPNIYSVFDSGIGVPGFTKVNIIK